MFSIHPTCAVGKDEEGKTEIVRERGEKLSERERKRDWERERYDLELIG